MTSLSTFLQKRLRITPGDDNQVEVSLALPDDLGLTISLEISAKKTTPELTRVF